MQNSNVSQYYLGVRVLDFSPGSIFVHSEISFRPDVYSETLFFDVFDLSNGIEDIIRLESSLGKTSLLIDTRQIYVSGKCISLDFNVCSSFYNATSFPNFYKHKTYADAVTYFQNDLQPVIDSGCSSLTSLFLCGLNFPSCNKARQLLPCRSVCQQYKTECSDSIDCSQFEDSTDRNICLTMPTTTTTTEQTTAMTTEDTTTTMTTEATTTVMTTEPSTTTMTTEATTTTMTTTEQTTTEPISTTPKALCEDVQAVQCQQVGINQTTFPNHFDQNSQYEALLVFNDFINDTCSENSTLFYCAALFPRCDEGALEKPCKDLCLAAMRECGDNALQLFTEKDCNLFNDRYCVRPLPSPPTPTETSTTPSTQPSTTPLKTTTSTEKCEAVQADVCHPVGLTKTSFPNFYGQFKQDVALKTFNSYINDSCSANATLFYCSSFFPRCDQEHKQNPCKSLCLAALKECGSSVRLASQESCDSGFYPEQDCVEPLPSPIPTQVSTTPSTTTQTTDLCEKVAYKECQQFSNSTIFPGMWSSTNHTMAVQVMAAYQFIVDMQCSSYSLKFFCSGAFHHCDKGVKKLPCRSLCEGMCNGVVRNFTSSSGVDFPARTYAHLVMGVPENEPGAYPSHFGYLVAKSTCKDNKVVSLQCVPKGCGQKLVGGGMVGYIVNGYTAAPGAWPWQAALELQVTGTTTFRKHLCGGVLISPNFVLTATHCVNEYTDVKLYRVILGAANRNNLGASSKTYEVERINRFDDKWYSFQSGDITLLQLKQTVEYTPYIQPICLPSESDVTPTTAICYGTGWGQLTGDKNGEFANDLQELKLKLWKTEKCNGSKAWNGKIAHGYVCGGYESGIRSMCSGDSGGPMVCQDNQNNWYLKGIASYVANYCNMTNRPNVFTDVQTYLGWINNNTKCIFKCRNGKCIYDSQLLCNREDNCGDNSDEIDQCDVSVNCTFDDKFMCGYGIEGFQQQRQILNSQDPTTLPSFDHTFGRYPGYYMAGKTPSSSGSEARLTSPKFTIQGSTCIRFFYNLRGDLNAGLKVGMYTFSTSGDRLPGQQVYASGEGVFTDKWRLGYIDLSIGTYEIAFIANDGMQVAVDDVSMHKGMCSQSVCLSNEYKCTSEAGSDACITLNSLCDVVKDCHSDELNCNHSERHYSCEFENSVLCDIQQETFDNGEWLIINQTYTRSFVLYSESFPDHTTGTDQGYMLFLMTNLLMRSEFVAMTLDVSLQDKDFCLTFWYRSKTEATFKVDILHNTTVMNLMSFTDRTTKDWTKAQMQLPPMNDAVIKFTVVTETPAIHSYYKPHLALDDIQISNGLCPDYGCPVNWSKCGNENYCYSPEEKCDRKLQCSDESDEINCNCTADEFRCNSGRCIPLSQKCDRIGQCLDGSDEGDICDPMNAVSCIFESPYLCGYTVLSNSSLTNEYKWLWTSGETPSFYTGPKTDHTTGTPQGHYMYAEGNDGTHGDQARMASIYFLTTTNQSLTFFFHMFLAQYTKTGGLQIALTEDGSDIENVIWFHNESSGEPWISGCVDLPANQNLSIIFISNRHSLSIQDADIAVDDIALRDGLCGTHSEPDVTTASAETLTETTPSTGCASDQFTCNNGICIPLSSRCDTFSDCINGEDELNCNTGP
ncbi:corin [Mytilus galloprovincialis]|nr:corin [Mytilus galloprovincialis]